jgi:hypothetical protein
MEWMNGRIGMERTALRNQKCQYLLYSLHLRLLYRVT